MRIKINSAEQLNLHDSILKLDSIDDSSFTIIANFNYFYENLIAEKKINKCRIIVNSPKIISFTLTGCTAYDDKGKFLYEKESKVFYDVEARNIFLEQLKNGFSVMGVCKQDNNIFCLSSNDDPVFDLEFSIESVYIELDDLESD